MLTAHKGDTWLALAATAPFVRCSCGYVGTTDGWQDLMQNLQMDWEFDCAQDGNIALLGELDVRHTADSSSGSRLARASIRRWRLFPRPSPFRLATSARGSLSSGSVPAST